MTLEIGQEFYSRRGFFRKTVEYGAAGAGAALFTKGSIDIQDKNNPVLSDYSNKDGLINSLTGFSLLTISPAFSFERNNNLTRRNLLFWLSAYFSLFYGVRVLSGAGKWFNHPAQEPIQQPPQIALDEQTRIIIPKKKVTNSDLIQFRKP